MSRYVCLNCNYRFESDNPGDCPNCGMEEFEKEKSAEELLGDVERILDG